MNMTRRTFTAAIHKEADTYVALCPELDIASQGETVEKARENLREAIVLFLESASAPEITERLHGEVYLSSLEVTIG
jgi:predicted RNase H-like HicB family nuclease